MQPDAAPQLTGLSHLDLSVSDRRTSAAWYSDVFGFEVRGDRFNEAARLHWMHLVHPVCGLSIGLVEHPDNPGAAFDERRSGLDHVSFAVATREEIERLARRVSELRYDVPAIVETSDARLLVLRDPDNIQVEVCFFHRSAGSI